MIDSNNSLPGLYVHIPFCQTKCPYCDFFSITSPDLIPAYLTTLDKEAQIYHAQMPLNGGTGVPPVPAQAKACGYINAAMSFDTLYLGGGTPSLLEDPQLCDLVACLRRYFHFASDCEITLEANPDDVTPEKLCFWRDLGVNRLSLGVQSFDEAELTFLGRRHTARQSFAALAQIRAAGFTNLGLDLIYGLPGQRPEDWLKTLERALDFEPQHLSCYQLTIDPETNLGRLVAAGQVTPLDEEAQRDFFLLTSRFLKERGYLHYEVSNFARGESFVCRHNPKYWRHVPYLGLGPGAHSFDGQRRWWNHRSLEQYAAALAQGRAPVAGSEALTAEQLRLETLYLGFRTREGVGLDTLRLHPRWEAALQQLLNSGLVRVHQDRVVATPAGLVVADRLPVWFV